MLRWLHLTAECLGSIPSSGSWLQLLKNADPGRQPLMMAQVMGPCHSAPVICPWPQPLQSYEIQTYQIDSLLFSFLLFLPTQFPQVNFKTKIRKTVFSFLTVVHLGPFFLHGYYLKCLCSCVEYQVMEGRDWPPWTFVPMTEFRAWQGVNPWMWKQIENALQFHQKMFI